MQYPIKLIAIDVDGTLLDEEELIVSGAAESIQAVKARGVEVILATGRNIPTLRWILDELGLWGPFIGSGGAFIADLSIGKMIKQHVLSMEDVQMFIQMSRERNLMMFMEHADWMLCEMEPVEFRDLKRLHKYTWKVVPDLLTAIPEPPMKAMVIGKYQQIEDIKKIFEKKHRPVHFSFSQNNYMEMVSQDVNKGNALTVLANYMSVPLKNIAAIGDYHNDIEMFSIAGISVAMGNAPKLVKQAATLIAPNNNEGGLVWALDKLVLEKKIL